MDRRDRDEARKNKRKVRSRPDLTFVPIERIAIVEHRLSVIENFLANPSRQTSDAVLAARELGINVPSFYRLVRLWKDDNDALRLAGSGATRTAARSTVFGDEDFLDEAFATLPPSGTVERDAEAITALAAERGIPLRSLTTLRKEVRRRRPGYERTSVPGDLVIARTAVSIPVEFGSEIAMPIATVLAHVETGHALAVRLAVEPCGPKDFIETLLMALEAGILKGDQAGASTIVFGGTRRDDHSELKAALAKVEISVPEEVKRGRRAANEWCSRRLERIRLRGHPQLGHQGLSKRKIAAETDLASPVTLAKAQTIVSERIAADLDGFTVGIAADDVTLASILLNILSGSKDP